MGPTVGLDGCRKSRPTGTRSLDRPARREIHFNRWEDNIKMYLKKEGEKTWNGFILLVVGISSGLL